MTLKKCTVTKKKTTPQQNKSLIKWSFLCCELTSTCCLDDNGGRGSINLRLSVIHQRTSFLSYDGYYLVQAVKVFSISIRM